MRSIVEMLSKADTDLEKYLNISVPVSDHFISHGCTTLLDNPFGILVLYRFGRTLATTFGSEQVKASTSYYKVTLRSNLSQYTIFKWTLKELSASLHEFLNIPNVSRYSSVHVDSRLWVKFIARIDITDNASDGWAAGWRLPRIILGRILGQVLFSVPESSISSDSFLKIHWHPLKLDYFLIKFGLQCLTIN